MIGFALLCMALGSILTIVAFLILNGLAQFNERTIDDIPELLRPQDPKIELQLFDPAVDEALRTLRVPVNFRRKQRVRFDTAAERYRNKRYHTRLLLQWGNTEWRDMHRLHTMHEYTQEAVENLQIARERGKRFLRLAPLVMARIWILRIVLKVDKFLLLPTPNVSDLRRLGSVDMLKLYDEFKLAMAEFARTYGEDESEQLRAVL
jgi:hypothetical protein